ncbi:MAG: ImmA/IrrE family metallo-endopeptidase [Oscillospiraceae bacterium]|nr:ImmA/IrrE family metallo-endopeptidase [Oscillospiraceae bacterium]
MNAAKILLNAGITTLPVDLKRIAESNDIKIVDYESCAECYNIDIAEIYRRISPYGFSFMAEGRYVCAINEKACGKRRRRWTLAHELAHVLLGHVSGVHQEYSGQTENEADRLAAQLLAPLSVLHFCGVSSAAEIARLCGISKQAADYRYEELCRLRRRHSDAYRAATIKGQAQSLSVFFPDQESRLLQQQMLSFIARYLTLRSAAPVRDQA